MRVELLIGDERHAFTPILSDCEPAIARAECACPNCGHDLAIVGKGRRRVGDVHIADAYCIRCHDEVGTVEARPESIFGEEEDEAVLTHGRARVYGGGLRA